MRVEIKPIFDDVAGRSLLEQVGFYKKELLEKIGSILVTDVFWIDGPDTIDHKIIEEVLADPLLQARVQTLRDLPSFSYAIERRLLPGMTDNLARTTREAFQLCGVKNLKVSSGQVIYLVNCELTNAEVEDLAKAIFYNPWIQTVKILNAQEYSAHWSSSLSSKEPSFPEEGSFTKVTISTMSDDELLKFSKKNLLALSLEEMKAIQNYFKEKNREPTDVEIEVIAQTWSEHCKHKIFAAQVAYQEAGESLLGHAPQSSPAIPAKIDSLFKTTISGTTSQLPKPWLLSVFSDNAGIVAFSPEEAVCIKVETHNSPSALDPFGGAITGIVGVNRDILGCGLGAKPIFNTNVFCVGPIDAPVEKLSEELKLPPQLIPPIRILEGVRRGVEAGGNQSGIPTVNGALVFDPTYAGKPLVFCGSGGVLPRTIAGRACETKEIFPGDLICMVGGRIGRDGIHGATFSSQELDESVPSSVVQLGDPITQRRMTDFLLEARDLGLYRAITDNGAGGLSSSVGEMAQLSGGAEFDVSLAKTKVRGLKAFELVISESQERMTLAVPPEKQESFLELARKRNVEVSVLGVFKNTGLLEIRYRENIVCALDLEFLHKGVPKLYLQAEWKNRVLAKESGSSFGGTGYPEILTALKTLLSKPNIRSKENMIRQYDHEVQGRSVVKGLTSTHLKEKVLRNSPNDAAVLALSTKNKIGIVVGCGIQPRLSRVDPYLMAQASVDEAIRNVLAVGAEFSLGDHTVLSLIDNFCWPDPVSDPDKMAALVRTCFGLQEICLKYGIPLISGKDSMKNDYRGEYQGKPVQISVVPTLLMTALGRMPDYEKARSADFKNAGDVLYVLGREEKTFGLVCTEFSETFGVDDSKLALPSFEMATQLYSWLGSPQSHGLLNSAHDLSEGGLLVAIAESCFTQNLGAELEAQDHRFWFGEGFHQFVVSVNPGKASQLEHAWSTLGIPFVKVGKLTSEPVFKVGKESSSLNSLEHAWAHSSSGGVV